MHEGPAVLRLASKVERDPLQAQHRRSWDQLLRPKWSLVLRYDRLLRGFRMQSKYATVSAHLIEQARGNGGARALSEADKREAGAADGRPGFVLPARCMDPAAGRIGRQERREAAEARSSRSTLAERGWRSALASISQ